VFELSVVNRRIGGDRYEVVVTVDAPGMDVELKQRLHAIATDRLKKGISVAVLQNGVVRAHGDEADLLIYRIAGIADGRNQDGKITVETDPVLSHVRVIESTARATAQRIATILRSPGKSSKWTVGSAVRGRAR
jgi:hypothetical protein